MHGKESDSQSSWAVALQQLWSTLGEQLQGLGGDLPKGATGRAVVPGGLEELVTIQMAHLASLQEFMASAGASGSPPGEQVAWTRVARQAAWWLPGILGPAVGGSPGPMAGFPDIANASLASGSLADTQKNPNLVKAWTVLATEWAMMLADGQRRLDDAIADESEDVTSYRRLQQLAIQSYDAAYDVMVSKRAYRQAFSALVNAQAGAVKRTIDQAVAARTRVLQQRITELEQALQAVETAGKKAKAGARQSAAVRRSSRQAAKRGSGPKVPKGGNSPVTPAQQSGKD